MADQALQTVSFIVSVLIMYACIFNLATVLPMRGRWLYLASSVISVAAINAVPDIWPGINQLRFALYGFLLPFVLMEAPVALRLVAIALCISLIFVGEFLLTVGIALVSGPMVFATAAQNHVVLVLVFRIIHVAINIVGGVAVRAFMARRLRSERVDDVLPRFGASVLLNAGLAIGFYYLTIVENLLSNDPLCIAGMFLSILFFPIDAGLLWSLERARRATVDEARGYGPGAARGVPGAVRSGVAGDGAHRPAPPRRAEPPAGHLGPRGGGRAGAGRVLRARDGRAPARGRLRGVWPVELRGGRGRRVEWRWRLPGRLG